MSANGHPFYDAVARFALRRRWAVIVAVLAVTGLAFHQITTRLYADNSLEAFMAGDDPTQVVLEELRDAFGREDMFVVVVEGDVFSAPYLTKLTALHRELAALDMDLPTLGQRKEERDELRHARKPVKKAPPVASQPAASDDFGGFEDLGGEGAGGWETEAGGSVVDEIVSLVNARRTVGDADSIVVTKWLDPLPPAEELPALREVMLAEPSLVSRLVGREGRHSCILIRTQFMDEPDMNRVYMEIDKITSKHAGPGFQPGIAGLPAIQGSIYVLMMRDVNLMTTLVFVLVGIFLWLIFRSPIMVFGPALVVALALVWMFGTAAANAWPMTFATNALPPFLVSIGVCEAIHVMTVYEDLRRKGVDNDEAIRRAIAITGLPCLLTSVTTSIGLLSFNFASLDSIRHMGTMAALGSLYAYVLTLLLLPIFLSYRRGAPRPKPASRVDLIDRVVNGLGGLSRGTRGRWAVLVTALALGVGATVVTVREYRIEHNPLSWVPADHPVVRAINTVDRHVSGSVDMTLLIEPKGEQGLKDPKLLAGMDALEREVLAYRHPERGRIVGGSLSVLDALRETNRALHGGDPAFYTIPTDARAIADQLFVFENAARDQLLRLVTPSYEKAQITFLVNWMQIGAFGDLIAHVDAAAARHIDPAVATVKKTGFVYGVASVLSGLIEDMFQSFGAACLIIAALMVVLFRSVKLGVIAMIPNILPILLVLGFTITIGMPVDWTNAMVGSLIIGIVVDDTIHFFHHFKEHYRETGDTEASLAECMRVAGRANVGTAFTVAGGFLVMVFAGMLNLRKFGILVAICVVVALLCELVVAPALLRTFYKARRIPGAPGASETGGAHAT